MRVPDHSQEKWTQLSETVLDLAPILYSPVFPKSLHDGKNHLMYLHLLSKAPRQTCWITISTVVLGCTQGVLKASENSSQAREKVEKIQLVAPVALGKSKNTGSCLDPAAEPLLLISIRAAITTLPSLGLHRPPSGRSSCRGHPVLFPVPQLPLRHLLFEELSSTSVRDDPSQRVKGQAAMLVGFVGCLRALRHCSRCVGAFPFPPYSLWLRSLTTSDSSSCSLGPLHESRRTVWT